MLLYNVSKMALGSSDAKDSMLNRRWRNSFTRLCFAMLAGGLLPPLMWSATTAVGFEHHHVHEHGKVTLNVAMDGPTLSIELDAPAANVVGFEHAPRTSEERAALSRVSTYLRAGRDLIGVPPAAQCHFVGTEYTEPKWESASDSDSNSHAASATAETQEHHADFDARINYRCDRVAELAWFEPWVLLKLLNLTEARVNILTATGQRAETVTSGHARIQLQ
jgi:Protein of unknown function (DUF2796)